MSDQLRRQRPHGLNELYGEQAAIKTALEDRLHEVFERWGYRRLILPTFGYYESLSAGASTDLQREMFRFFDREGNIIALRADMTPLTARLVGTRLYDSPMPLRFYYSGSVFRHEKPQAGQRHEFTQAGEGLRAVFLLRAVPLRLDDDDAICGDAPVGEREEPVFHLLRQR